MHPDRMLATLRSVEDRLARYLAADVDLTISAADAMYQPSRHDHYFAVGRDAVGLIAEAMVKAGVDSFAQVIDLPCGAGRVLRHLLHFLPDATFTASDIDSEQLDYCARRYGARRLPSQADLTRVHPEVAADLLFCGSLLTHLPEKAFTASLKHMLSWLAPRGVAIFTLHGRWALQRQLETPHKYVDDASFAPVSAGVQRTGFGYADFANADWRLGMEHYGMSVSLPSWVMSVVEQLDEVRVLDFRERGWDDHQDVLMVQRKPIAARPWIYEDTPT